ncbi:maltokinase N-terminal cap-like domain-containing protein [Microbacterium immunditiarum]|uniref:Maltokinase n=1 Tax=Microbacterium immunditiarum TaxID=337480 RepID=A0A7Y9GQZ2_9MICO|nr:phosphotransferase [Microbacterium immunditiarum]NYE19955.1 putative trehalose synthase [Microbacterium immunditiarum]
MDSTLACLAAWMTRQRWYAGKGRAPSLRLVAWFDLAIAGQEADAADPALLRVRTFLVLDEGALPVVLYQVPIVARATASVEDSGDHVIGDPEPGVTFIDGPHDPVYARALFSLVTRGGAGSGPRTTARGVPAADFETHTASYESTVLTGEQSNTSIIYRSADGGPSVICKVFRQLHPGLNPDIELQSALCAAGSTHVPAAVGLLEGTWPDLATAGGSVSGSLAFAQEFLPDVDDAWRVALRAAARREDFSASAREIGEATADVHVALARLFPTHETHPGDREATAATWTRRLTMAIAEVPGIAEQRDAIEAVYARALEAAWPPLQRIHGDLHLGQVLHSPGRGWVLLDFEGEPLRPMAERVRADLALRDVAGMLRSFDYVAGSIRLDTPEQSPDAALAWARDARRAFLDGYAAVSGLELDVQRDLLAALEIDKAVYEAIYEARNRPTWVPIPLRAIARLVEQPAVNA